MRKAIVCCLLLMAEPLIADDRADFTRDVKPILAARCYACHGALKQEAGLRLDAGPAVNKGGTDGPIVNPGHSAASLLVEKITSTEEETRMPPEGSPLEPVQIARIKSWIDGGAKVPNEPLPASPDQHWAFVAPSPPPIPKTGGQQPVNPIDGFLAAEHQARGLTPARQAEKQVLLRRVYLDLIGLPPTRDELRAFLVDTSPGAYETVVDRLLASPQYGERWGRHWMDIWRYSDWAGFGDEVRDSQRHIWRWRDWIVESLNADKAYDQMVREMLAADELTPRDKSALRATGFLARNYFRFSRHVWLDRAVEHTGKALLGLTFNCARCHDHKFDPIAQTDYYKMQAFFEPYEVRIDRLPGQADLHRDGIPRVFDAQLDAPTYLFARGDDRNIIKDVSYKPGLPAVFKTQPAIRSLKLPLAAYYPGSQDFIQREEIARRNKEVDAALLAVRGRRARLAVVEERLANLLPRTSEYDAIVVEPRGKPGLPGPNALAVVDKTPSKFGFSAPGETIGKAASKEPAKQTPVISSAHAQAEQDVRDVRLSLALQEARLASARAQRAAVEARVAADDARYSAAANAQELSKQASKLDREAQLAVLKEKMAQTRREISEAEKQNRANPAVTGPLKLAREKLAKIQESLTAAEKAMSAESTEYAPLGPMYPQESTGRRAALARWITGHRNPLTARVAVNHIWARHFGAPLVPTVFDFGHAGKPPAMPKLLDWLACNLEDGGWSMKKFHRLIVTSQAYRREGSDPDVEVASGKVDPQNAYLWRMNRRRMEGEIVRDSVLWVSGQLDLTMGGPDLDPAAGFSSHRRSIYFRNAYQKQMQFLTLFDAPSVTECYRRSESVVPQQALALANSPLTLQQSRALAEKFGKVPDLKDDTAFVDAVFEAVLTRAPSAGERTACLAFLTAVSKSVPGDKAAAAAGLANSSKQNPALRARARLAHVLLNHSDFVTIP